MHDTAFNRDKASPLKAVRFDSSCKALYDLPTIDDHRLLGKKIGGKLATPGRGMIRLLLNIVLIISIFLSCYFEDAFLSLWNPRVGKRAPVTIRLPQPDAGLGLPDTRQATSAWQIGPPQESVPFMKKLDEQDIQLIGNYRRDATAASHRDAPFILFTMIFMAGFLAVFLDLPPRAGSRSASSPNLILTLLILHLLLLKVLLLAAPLPAAMLPFGMLPLLLVALNQSRAAVVGVSLAAAVLASLFVDRTYPG
jgi:hypothetical protein